MAPRPRPVGGQARVGQASAAWGRASSVRFGFGLAALLLGAFLLQALLLALRGPQPGFWDRTAWSALFALAAWFPVVGAAWKRFHDLTRHAVARHAADPEGAEDCAPGGLFATAQWSVARPREAWLARLAAGIVGGAFTVAALRLLGAGSLYPWDLLSFLLGCTGGGLLVELVFYAGALTHVHTPGPCRDHPGRHVHPVDPFDPDGYGGHRRLAEEAASLMTWLFVLMLLGNAFFVTHRQVDDAAQPGEVGLSAFGYTVRADWDRVTVVLGMACTAAVLLLYVAVHLTLGAFFARNRWACIEHWQRRYRDAADGEGAAEAREGLAKAWALRASPAPIGPAIRNATLALTTAVGFFAGLADLAGMPVWRLLGHG